nr:hypothetical protein [Pseudomonas sp. BIGb0427]
MGRPTRNASELLAFWEYIRRYMDEGPEAAPKPTKLIGKFPLAMAFVHGRLAPGQPFDKTPALWVFVLVYSLLLPLIVIHAFGHWVSCCCAMSRSSPSPSKRQASNEPCKRGLAGCVASRPSPIYYRCTSQPLSNENNEQQRAKFQQRYDQQLASFQRIIDGAGRAYAGACRTPAFYAANSTITTVTILPRARQSRPAPRAQGEMAGRSGPGITDGPLMPVKETAPSQQKIQISSDISDRQKAKSYVGRV